MSKTIPIEQAVQIALEQHRAGHYARAEALYVEILRQDPGNIDAIHLLGVLALQGGAPDAAVQFIGRAISRRGDVPMFHYNYGDALTATGRPDEAIASYQRALELDPEYVDAYNNLANLLNGRGDYVEAERVGRAGLAVEPDNSGLLNGLGTALRGQGQLAEAESVYRQALATNADNPDLLNNLAMCLCAQGQLEAGAESFRRAIALRPAWADLHNNLGTTLVHLRQIREAAYSFRTAIDIDPKHAEAISNLGSALRSLGKLDEAHNLYSEAIELKPDFVEARVNLAAVLHDLGRHADALVHLDRAIGLRPNVAKMHFLRGVILRDLRRYDEGIAAIRRTIELDPRDPLALTTLGYALLERGEVEEAADVFARTIEMAPDAGSLSNVLMSVNYHPKYTPADLFAMHRRWSELHEAPFAAARRPHTNDRGPGRRLRVGYVSPDFRSHSVAYFLEPILAHHDHAQVEIYAYAHLVNVDLNTYWLRSKIDRWRETAGRTGDQIEAMIRDDCIDILVDCAGHTGSNLLPVFARKPAPVQINMIGFPSTTGLSAIDYRITDALCDPPGVSDAVNSETLIRMPGLFWVYQPPAEAMAVGPLPADENGYVTFTSVNNFTKVTPAVQALWARLLLAVPGSKLIIQTTAMSSPQMQELVIARFAGHGVGAERLEFRPWSSVTAYLKLLERSDLTLDPYPFNGGTTTCHSLWMGAPVLSRAGDRHASRMGLSILTAVGLPEFVAHTDDEYVEIGQRMAHDLSHLREVRRKMRERLQASPLLDGAGYSRELEAVYRSTWATWCASGSE